MKILDFSNQIKAAKENKTLNKPFRTPNGPKKFGVYVKNDKGNIVLVRFGDPNMEIKRDDPKRRAAFRSRHSCDDNPGPKWKARYWSCKMWESKKSVTDYLKGEESTAARPGPKSGAQTPSKPSERRKGSSKNPAGTSTKKNAAKITFTEAVINSLKNKVKEHNKQYPSKKVTLAQLKAVYRRGAGAFSSTHRPGKTRGQWAMARVNMFLKMAAGQKVKDAYKKADQDLL